LANCDFASGIFKFSVFSYGVTINVGVVALKQ
jgi:hypothetical protein